MHNSSDNANTEREMQECKSFDKTKRQKAKKQKRENKKKANKCIMYGVRYDRVNEKEHIYFVSRHINEIN